jgi:hypothetical protein
MHVMNGFHCTPQKPWGFHPTVRNDEDCPRCGWTAPGPHGDARRQAERLAAHGWTLIDGGAERASPPETRAA